MINSKRHFIYSYPILLWLTFFFTLPSLLILGYSFLVRNAFGGVKITPFEMSGSFFQSITSFFKANLSLAGYSFLTNPGERTVFYSLLGNTIFISAISSVIIILLAIPTALFITRSKWKNQLILFIIIPFWTNFLIRIYAFKNILGNNGLLVRFFNKIADLDIPLLSQFFSQEFQFLYGRGAIILVTVYVYLPYAILPLFTSIEQFDFSLVDAARDLGASKYKAYKKIFLPNIMPAINTAFLFTFVPSLGSYAIPKMVGDAKRSSKMIGVMIASELNTSKNYPKAAAITFLLILLSITLLLAFNYINSKSTYKKLQGGK